MENITVLLVLCIIAVVLLTPAYFRWRERMALLQLVRTSSDSGKALSAEEIHALRGRRGPSPARDLRRGAMLSAIGLALFLIGLCAFFTLDPDESRDGTALFICGLGIIPACIGGAFLFLAYSERKLVKD